MNHFPVLVVILDILVWPEPGSASFIGLFLFIGALLVTFILFQVASYRKKRRSENIDIVMHHAYDRHVAGKEIQRLKAFLANSSDKDLEAFRQSFGNMRKPLLIYVREHPDKDSVRLYQRLAVEGLGSTMDGDADVHRGEIGLTELGGKKYLFLITDIGEQLEFVLPNSAPRIQGDSITAYMYRPQSGGYNVSITIDKKLSGGHYMGDIAAVEEAEDRHRMAFMELDGKIRAFIPETGLELGDKKGKNEHANVRTGPAQESTTKSPARQAMDMDPAGGSAAPPMPHRGQPGKAGQSPPKKDSSGAEETEREIIEFTIMLEKISDRAAVFSTDHDLMSYTRFHHLWELHLTLFDGTEFMTRGIFSPLPQGSHRYLFRFQETEPAKLVALKKEIENNQPFPERMN
ncbi:MAG: hypothetical protein CMN76_05445 [Spirochaetaceae bacterium]|nr:hypothetical protein [Spirochaetaceae bacterium]|tara:strand:+ start:113364 stop:114572 length:1209 start_codon:yes stop_codon:yes gene_type:complete